MEPKKEEIGDPLRNLRTADGARVDNKSGKAGPDSAGEKAQQKLNRWQAYQQYQSATERVLRTLNFTEALAIIFLFVYAPVATYGFIPMAGILWVVLLFGGTRFSKEVEEHFPDDAMMREYTKDADARSANPFRWGEFIKSSNGRLFAFAFAQAAAILLLLFVR